MNETKLKALIAELIAQRDSGLNALAEMKGEYAMLAEERDQLKAELDALKSKDSSTLTP